MAEIVVAVPIVVVAGTVVKIVVVVAVVCASYSAAEMSIKCGLFT